MRFKNKKINIFAFCLVGGKKNVCQLVSVEGDFLFVTIKKRQLVKRKLEDCQVKKNQKNVS